VNVIRELNDLPTGGLAVGDDLRVPSAVPEARQGHAGRRARRWHGRSVRRAHVQVVRRGESLWTIARRNRHEREHAGEPERMHPTTPCAPGSASG